MPAQTVLGLIVAMLLEQAGRAAGYYRAAMLAPWFAPSLIMAATWRWILEPEFGTASSLVGRRVDWLADGLSAQLVTAAVLVWAGVGYSSLFFTVALRAVPPAILDAAALDGAGIWVRTSHIVLPSIRPMLGFVLLTSTAQALTTFDAVVGLTGGGPDGATEVLALRMYRPARIPRPLLAVPPA